MSNERRTIYIPPMEAFWAGCFLVIGGTCGWGILHGSYMLFKTALLIWSVS